MLGPQYYFYLVTIGAADVPFAKSEILHSVTLELKLMMWFGKLKLGKYFSKEIPYVRVLLKISAKPKAY